MSLLVLALQVFLLGILAIGGASATLPEMHRVFVDTYHVLSQKEFSDLYALSQSAPGPNVMFVALFGWRIAGFAGALVSFLAMCVPTSLLAIGVEEFGGHYRESRVYRILKSALTPIAIGLLLSTAVLLIRGGAAVGPWILTAVTFLSLWFWGLNPLWLLGLGALFGGLGWLGS